MSTHKRIDHICIAAALLTLVLTALFMNGRMFGIEPILGEEAGNSFFTANDLNADWDTSSATKIVLSDEGSSISGNGAYVYDGDVYIVYGGNYILTGEYTKGSVVVDADKKDKIRILLDGADIHCEDGAAIRVEQAGKVFLTLADGTENNVSSGASYKEEAVAAGVDGVIYSRDDLTINGNGSLFVNAGYRHGIVCNDDLAVAGGKITINAVQDGIHANDSVRIRESEILVSAGDDGVTVSNDEETAFLYVESGNVVITDCYEGLEAVDITIAGGTIEITSTDDGINVAGSGSNSVIRITGGDITIGNPSGKDADGLDSNGSIYIEGGRVFISVTDDGGNSAIDYGSENGGECVVSGGTVIACGSSMMAEGFDAGSPQGFLMYQTAAQAGTEISLEDSTGREILSEEIPYGFSSVVLSTPELEVGDVCVIVVDGEREQMTVDNVSSSGFGRGRMAGGDMGGGKGRNGAVGPSDEIELPGGAELPDGMTPPDGEGLPDGMEPPDGGGLPDGMEPPDREGLPDGVELPEGAALPDGMEPPDSAEFPGGMEPPDRKDSDAKAVWGDNIPSMQEEQGRTTAESVLLSSESVAGVWILVGVSVLVLLIGLGIAIKIKH